MSDDDMDASSFSSRSDDELDISGFKNLKDKDPDFYEFLLENEKSLLDFKEDEDDDDDASDEEEESSKKTSKSSSASRKVTSETVLLWADQLSQTPISITVIKDVMEAFRASVAVAAGDSEVETKFKVSPDMFDDITRCCFVHLTPAIFKLLSLPIPGVNEESKSVEKIPNPKKCKNWKPLATPMKKYLLSLVQVLNVVTDESVICGLLRHSLHMIPFIPCFAAVTKKFLNRVIQLWSESAEKVRILSFLCVVRSLRGKDSDTINHTLKRMYLSFAKNSRLTSQDTLSMISFMQQSLVELYSLDQGVAYTQAFDSLRQCAITLKTAKNKPAKETLKAVYCWPFIHSLVLWQKLLSTLHPSDALKPLTLPLIQISIGVLTMTTSAQYEPLRFIVIRSLIKLSSSLDVFIPILPFVLSTMERVDYSHKITNNGKKVDLNCLLKVPKNELHDKWFRDAIMKNVHQLVLEYTASQSHRIGFPELVFPALIRMKKFIKESCKNAEDSKILKQAVDKIQENSSFIESKRNGVTFKFSDVSAVDAWEEERIKEGTPLMMFYSKWKELRTENDKRQIREQQEARRLKKEKKKGGHDATDMQDDSEKSDSDVEDVGRHELPEKVGKRSLSYETSKEKTKKKRRKKRSAAVGERKGNSSVDEIEVGELELSDDE